LMIRNVRGPPRRHLAYPSGEQGRQKYFDARPPRVFRLTAAAEQGHGVPTHCGGALRPPTGSQELGAVSNELTRGKIAFLALQSGYAIEPPIVGGSEIEPNDRLPRLTTRSNLCLVRSGFLAGGIEVRIRWSRTPDRSWIVVLASGVGLFAVLANGFHWFVEPVILDGRSRLPTETLVAYRNSALGGPTTSGHSLRAAKSVSLERSEPPSPPERPVMAKAADEADSKVPDNKPAKKESNRNVTRRANDRVVRQPTERRGSWNFSSSPASPNYR
jgi:hypothetical protein